MSVKDSEVKHLRISTGCVCGSRLARGVWAIGSFDGERRWRSLREGRNIDNAGLVGIFISRTSAAGSDGSEVMLGTAKWDSDYCHLTVD
jgi:hypothetical protein